MHSETEFESILALAASLLFLPKFLKCKADFYISKALVAGYRRYKKGLDAWLGTSEHIELTNSMPHQPVEEGGGAFSVCVVRSWSLWSEQAN